MQSHGYPCGAPWRKFRQFNARVRARIGARDSKRIQNRPVARVPYLGAWSPDGRPISFTASLSGAFDRVALWTCDGLEIRRIMLVRKSMLHGRGLVRSLLSVPLFSLSQGFGISSRGQPVLVDREANLALWPGYGDNLQSAWHASHPKLLRYLRFGPAIFRHQYAGRARWEP